MNNRMPLMLLRTLKILLLAVSAGAARAGELPAGFVYVDEVIPEIVLEIRYYSEDNFTGRRVTGYERRQAFSRKRRRMPCNAWRQS